MNKLTKSTLSLAVAGMFAFSSTAAFATETDENNENAGLEVVAPETENSTTGIDTEVTNEETTTETEADEVAVEAPSVLPGDFFYFAKIALEKIKLAFTINEEKEAKLLATYAAERLAEAEALFANGEEEKAIETLQTALTNLDSASEFVVEDEEVTEDVVEEDSTEVVVEEEEVTEETTSEETVTEETVEDEAATEEEVTETDENATTEETEADDSENTESTDDSLQEVEKLISQNIIALKAALSHVKNPVAKAALERNIEKSYAKLAKKLEKLNKKLAELEETSEEQEVEITEETGTGLDVVTDVEMEEDNTEAVEGSVVVDETQEDSQSDETVVKAIKQEQKESIKEVKQELKEVKKQVKAEEKESKKAEKLEKKQEKAENKNTKKQENKGNSKGNSNGKDNN